MTSIYERITRAALAHPHFGVNAAEAWEQACQALPGAPSTRRKGCPRSAFVSLAEHGYIRGHTPGPVRRPLTENASYCLVGAALLAEQPELARSKARLWEAIQKRGGITRHNHNGVLDVLLALHQQGALVIQSPAHLL
ncbi:DUF6979 family protein [Deinococcus apachensis]|uniref:DUF6979 family protein n=1 Tax=Deinococcus apachensis TaxID=309886 RepID=UPI000361DA63|nr:hypothetical protein [Deinococcus apachensis]